MDRMRDEELDSTAALLEHAEQQVADLRTLLLSQVEAHGHTIPKAGEYFKLLLSGLYRFRAMPGPRLVIVPVRKYRSLPLFEKVS